ncbi:class I SAM-dependent methyltransferase [Sabulicella rubraurantiaca]|uniref:class I SAM-dependent methyltransferase n=1 Tax=Sabulicella rubraurantiaca TaxID=2811429 RepID=UPI001F225869|nr:class I SAM-dependent methyltransferase [Sabulicella rubraurantiaca]
MLRRLRLLVTPLVPVPLRGVLRRIWVDYVLGLKVDPAVALPEHVEREFRSFAEWKDFLAENEVLVSRARMESIIAHARRRGIHSTLLGRLPPSAVELRGLNIREEFLAGGFSPRLRAVMERVLNHPRGGKNWDLRIHAHEALTNFALLLRGRYARCLCSEYAGSEEEARKLHPIPSIDITRSGLPDASFDLIVSNEVLEHVPDLDAALRDMARILAPGGRLIATFPVGEETTDQRAAMEGGTIRHLAQPEYHGNPLDPEGGSLVFQIPGWDILDQAKRAGFRDPRFVFISSHWQGMTANDPAGVLVFEAER